MIRAAVLLLGFLALASSALAQDISNPQTNASALISGALPAGRMPALTGDCTTAAGAVSTTCTKTNGVAFGTAATVNTGASGPVIPLANTNGIQWAAPPTFLTGLVTGSVGGLSGSIALAGATSGNFALQSSATGAPIWTNVPASTAALNYMCYSTGTGAVTYDNTSTCLVSSLRYKHDVRQIRNPLATIMAMDPIDFVYNDQSNQPGRQYGLSAESVAKAAPILATYDKQGRPEKVKYIEIIGLLTAAVQKQQAEILALERRIPHSRAVRKHP